MLFWKTDTFAITEKGRNFDKGKWAFKRKKNCKKDIRKACNIKGEKVVFLVNHTQNHEQDYTINIIYRKI